MYSWIALGLCLQAVHDGLPTSRLVSHYPHPATNMQQSYDFESLSNRWLAIEPRPCLLELSSQAEQCRLVAVARYQLN